MLAETFSSPRNLKRDHILGWLSFIAVFLSLFMLVLLFSWLVKTENTLVGTLLGLSIFFGGVSAYYFLKDANSLFHVILTTDNLRIETIYYNSENASQQYDWTSISNLILVEEKMNLYVIGYKLKISIAGTTEEKEFLLRRYSKSFKQQQMLYQRVHSFWIDSLKAHKGQAF